MQLGAEEQAILDKAADFIGFENHPIWVNLKAYLRSRVEDIEQQIEHHLESNYAPNKDLLALLLIRKEERRAVVREVEKWVNEVKQQRDEIIEELKNEHQSDATADR